MAEAFERQALLSKDASTKLDIFFAESCDKVRLVWLRKNLHKHDRLGSADRAIRTELFPISV